MPHAQEQIETCQLCGASIYPQHRKSGAADYLAGKLLCPHCLKEKKQVAAVNPAAAFADLKAAGPSEPLPLADVSAESADPSPPAAPAPAAAGRGGSVAGMAAAARRQFLRPLAPNSPHATRCRTFHCKLNDQSIAHMNDVINEWVDSHDDVVIKFATNTIGIVEGKSSSDPNLFVTVFY